MQGAGGVEMEFEGDAVLGDQAARITDHLVLQQLLVNKKARVTRQRDDVEL